MKENSGKIDDTREQIFSGWVSTIRDLGSVKFIILRNSKGPLQIVLKKGLINDQLLSVVDKLNFEDVISVRGRLIKRRNAPRGMEVIPSELTIINKAETPLPIDVSGKIESNLDTRLNWRTLVCCQR